MDEIGLGCEVWSNICSLLLKAFLDQSQFLSPMHIFHFISCAWACLHCSKCVNSIQEGGGEGAIASTISRQAGKPRCWSNNFTVADVTGEPRLHLFIHLLQLCIFSKTMSKPKKVWGCSVIQQLLRELCFQMRSLNTILKKRLTVN